ncbi:MAG: oligosaccharide flippase family protein, partial [Acidobacteria bacterium]|nr:oligosaccharide flippase family protein [Acidobacteriota bacterium]
DYGLWATIGQALGYLALLDLGVGSAVVRRAAQLRERDDTEIVSRVISTAVSLYCLLGLVILIVGLSLAALLPRWSAIPNDRTSVAVTIFIIMVVYTAVSLPLRIATSALIGYQHIAAANLINFAANLLTPIVAVVMLVFGAGLLALPVGTVLAGLLSAIAAIIILFRVVPNLRLSFRGASREEARELFRVSWQLFLANVGVVLIYQTDNLVIAAGAGLTAVTVYTLTSRLPLYAMPLVFAIGDSCLPGIIELYQKGDRDHLRVIYLRVMRLTAAAGLGVAVVTVAYNKSFMRLWVGDQNYGGMTLTLLLALIMLHRVMRQVASLIVIGSGKLKGIVYMALLEAALNLALSLWWVRYYGINGVALGTVVAGALTSGWYVAYFVSRELRMSVFEYVWRGMGPPLVCAVPAAGLAVLLNNLYPATSWPRLFISAAAVASAYAVSYLFIGFATEERRAMYARLVRFYRALRMPSRARLQLKENP